MPGDVPGPLGEVATPGERLGEGEKPGDPAVEGEPLLEGEKPLGEGEPLGEVDPPELGEGGVFVRGGGGGVLGVLVELHTPIMHTAPKLHTCTMHHCIIRMQRAERLASLRHACLF